MALEMTLSSFTLWLLLNICCHWSNVVNGRIMAYRRISNQVILIEEFNDMPAQFGNSIPSTGLRVFAVPSSDRYGCNEIRPPPNSNDDYPHNAKFAVIIERGGRNCTFEKKVRQAQASNYSAAIIYNNEGDELEHMSAKNVTGIKIPSVFVGLTAGASLKTYLTSEVILVINDELPFNINTQLILPFSILIGLCFLVMIFYMIYKCVREQRRLRRYRLPKKLLKKLPIIKYSTKNTDLTYDTCVICLDEFVEGDKLRVLPCKHPYHSECIDTWLTQNKRDCPICKRKVFTKGATNTHNRNRQLLDSLIDTDDDTTPLLQQPNRRVTATAVTTGRTRHGTFRRSNSFGGGLGDGGGHNVVPINDTGTFLGGHTDTTTDDEMMATVERRINPFDRSPNLPAHLAAQLNTNVQRRSIWPWSIFRMFTRRADISIAAPPYQEDILNDNMAEQLDPYSNSNGGSVATPAFQSSSNNILNPNLSGSFKVQPKINNDHYHDDDDDDDDDDPLIISIYEPSNAARSNTPNISLQPQTSINNSTDIDSVFIQTPTSGGLGVAALPSNDNELESQNRPRDTYGLYV